MVLGFSTPVPVPLCNTCAQELTLMIRPHGHPELLETFGEIFSETVEHLEEVNSSETNALTCLFVKESLIFSVLVSLHSHIPPPKF